MRPPSSCLEEPEFLIIDGPLIPHGVLARRIQELRG